MTAPLAPPRGSLMEYSTPRLRPPGFTPCLRTLYLSCSFNHRAGKKSRPTCFKGSEEALQMMAPYSSSSQTLKLYPRERERQDAEVSHRPTDLFLLVP